MKADELHAKFQVGTMFNHVRFLARNGEVDAEDRTMVVPPAVPSLLPRGVSLQKDRQDIHEEANIDS